MGNQPEQTPLLDLARAVPRDLRVTWPIQWSEDGLHETGHAMSPIGKHIHELADEVETLRERIRTLEAGIEREAAYCDREWSLICGEGQPLLSARLRALLK